MGAPLLEVKDLTKIFIVGGVLGRRPLYAVDHISFTLPGDRPTIMTLAGESGSGKTTTARLILGFLKPTYGEIRYKGKNIWEMSKEEWRIYRREVQAIFQDPYSAFNPVYKVDHALLTPIRKFHIADTREEAYELISRALEEVGLRPEEVLGKYPHQLSGGQRQRIMLARAFLIRPRLIVADEPVSMLDASIRASILNIMLDMKKRQKVSFLYITHDLSTAYYISDYIAIMYRGSIVEMGDISKVIEEPLHPYTKLLIDSVPVPDPKHRWKTRIVLPYRELTEEEMRGCKFYSRCPYKTDICKESRPSLKRIDDHLVACHLYKV